MKEDKEIKALLHLIDDPDEEVFATVSDKIISLGKEIIPNLESIWEASPNPELQERIENIIHRLHFSDLTTAFASWKAEDKNLLTGALLVARYQYPDLDTDKVMQEVEKMRRNIWLELSNYYTSLEQAKIIAGIIYNYFKLKGTEINYNNTDEFLINKVLESKKGNSAGNGILYLCLCEMLDIPVKCIGIPRQFILGYTDVQAGIIRPAAHPADKIKFFIDPLNGQIYSHSDVENYFKRITVTSTPSYYKAKDNVQVIQFLLAELARCFDNEANRYKTDELEQLINLLDE